MTKCKYGITKYTQLDLYIDLTFDDFINPMIKGKISPFSWDDFNGIFELYMKNIKVKKDDR